MPTQEDDFDEATKAVAAPGTTAPLPVVVQVTRGEQLLGEQRLARGSCVVGSGKDATLVVAEPTVSRLHVELTLVPEGVAVRDLESRNGTRYLGQRVERMVLRGAGRLSIGDATVTIEPDASTIGAQPLHPRPEYRGMLGAAASMRRLFAILARLEGSLVTVLVEGESGAGKELVASAIHEGSRVASGPLVVVNCGAIPRELVGSELFGHRKGAFTGAHEARRGAFDAADGGTLFLDELGELPLEVQPQLLRALEAGEVRPVGSDAPHRVRVRVVAATNRDLDAEVRAGRFREDLFYRLAVVRVRVPPLRERAEDVPALARAFAERLGVELPDAIVAELGGRPWPGNVRELRNAVQAYAALGVLPEAARAEPGELEAALAAFVDPKRPYAEQKDALTDRFTRLYLEALLRDVRGNQSAAARIAGLDRTYLGRLLAKYGVHR